MLPVKFRAWDEQNKTMHTNFQFIKSGDEGNDWIVFTSDQQTLQSNPHPLNNPFFQEQLKISQYTGCKDTNQKEIYVGDIVTVPGIGKTLVDISPELGMVYLHNGTEYASLDCTVERDYPTVIGNIYENPELLK